MSDIVKVLRDLCDNNYNDNFEKVLNDLLDYYDHDNTGVVKALDSINESISLEGLDAMEAAIEEIKKLRAENERLRNEKVAGQDTAKPEAIERSTPATDPAPAVCEWTDSGGMLWATNCGQSYGAFVSRFGKDAYCPHCDKIIKFSWRTRNEPVAAY